MNMMHTYITVHDKEMIDNVPTYMMEQPFFLASAASKAALPVSGAPPGPLIIPVFKSDSTTSRASDPKLSFTFVPSFALHSKNFMPYSAATAAPRALSIWGEGGGGRGGV